MILYVIFITFLLIFPSISDGFFIGVDSVLEAFEIASGVVHGAWMLVVTVVLYKLWNKVEAADQVEPANEEWEPVELNDQREYELEKREKIQQYWIR